MLYVHDLDLHTYSPDLEHLNTSLYSSLFNLNLADKDTGKWEGTDWIENHLEIEEIKLKITDRRKMGVCRTCIADQTGKALLARARLLRCVYLCTAVCVCLRVTS